MDNAEHKHWTESGFENEIDRVTGEINEILATSALCTDMTVRDFRAMRSEIDARIRDWTSRGRIIFEGK